MVMSMAHSLRVAVLVLPHPPLYTFCGLLWLHPLLSGASSHGPIRHKQMELSVEKTPSEVTDIDKFL